MMNINERELSFSLRKTLSEIEQQIETITENFNRTVEASGVTPISIHKIVDVDGRPILTDLTIAKAQVLSALANLQAASR